ncbi:MAG: hypothetical protein MMC33_005594 [Icmadophila ericetorum]|nr:hypothetical protein [Icmadophila ericetorum]
MASLQAKISNVLTSSPSMETSFDSNFSQGLIGDTINWDEFIERCEELPVLDRGDPFGSFDHKPNQGSKYGQEASRIAAANATITIPLERGNSVAEHPAVNSVHEVGSLVDETGIPVAIKSMLSSVNNGFRLSREPATGQDEAVLTSTTTWPLQIHSTDLVDAATPAPNNLENTSPLSVYSVLTPLAAQSVDVIRNLCKDG